MNGSCILCIFYLSSSFMITIYYEQINDDDDDTAWADFSMQCCLLY